MQSCVHSQILTTLCVVVQYNVTLLLYLLAMNQHYNTMMWHVLHLSVMSAMPRLAEVESGRSHDEGHASVAYTICTIMCVNLHVITRLFKHICRHTYLLCICNTHTCVLLHI